MLSSRCLIGFAAAIAVTFPAQAQSDPNLPAAPLLRIETGTHTAVIKGIAADRDCTTVLTGSDDKTARLWSVPASGGAPLLLRTLRPPIGAGDLGKIYTVALTPDGTLAAVAGWNRTDRHFVMLFDTASGRMVGELGPLDNVVNRVALSSNGRYLAAALGQGKGVHVWERQGAAEWNKLLADTDFGSRDSYGVAFGPDHRLYAVGDDGTLRRYSRSFKREAKVDTAGGREPYSVAVHPDGKWVAVGYDDTSAVELYDAETLRLVHTADATGVERGVLSTVAWSNDGSTLWAAGTFSINSIRQTRAYGGQGRGSGRSLPTPAGNTIRQIIACRDGIAFASADPGFGLLDASGRQVSWQGSVTIDMRRKLEQAFLVSADGLTIRLGLDHGAERPALLDLRRSTLVESAEVPSGLVPARTTGLALTDWKDNRAPKLDGRTLRLNEYEDSRSLAIAADGRRFVIGTSWNLRGYDRDGKELWQVATPGAVWGVNITAQDRLVIAALGDGTVRWYDLRSGNELAAWFGHARDGRWVAWTPRGHYMASERGDDLIGWHQNRGFGQAATFSFASQRRDEFLRPELVRRAITDLTR